MSSATAAPETTVTPAADPGPSAPADLHSTRGLLLGLAAATCYSIANLALRQLATGTGGLAWDIWISGMKALPTAVIAGWLLWQRRCRGEQALPHWRLLGPLLLAALLMQFGGNVGFQLSLRAIGLAISVPIVFASIIVSGAVVGRMALGDPVTPRTAFSMGLMSVSIFFLSVAAQSAGAASADSAPSLTSPVGGSVLAGVLIALVSGLSYGLCGVVIRRVVRGHLPVESTLFIFSMTGLVTLCPLSAPLLGWQALSEISRSDWLTMLAAGTFNAFGFFAITHAMRLLTINRANVINASQNAMCALGAVVFFAEPLSSLALVGIGLTIVGLLTLDRK